jgi:hypothetical protein
MPARIARKVKDITAEEVRHLFSYDPETGSLRWRTKPSPNAHLSKVGKEVGYVRNGYRMVTVRGAVVLASRLAWLHHFGEWPARQLEFKDGDATNIRIANMSVRQGLDQSFDHKSREGRSAYLRAHRAAFPEHYRERVLRNSFGLTSEDYERMHAEQSGVCAICFRPETMLRWGKNTPLSVDHCHETGKVRGLLCASCNQMIGKAGDSIELLRNAIEYLRRHSDEPSWDSHTGAPPESGVTKPTAIAADRRAILPWQT